jgi:citrate synthase
VHWNARISWNYNYTKGSFVWWDDSGKIIDITSKTWTDFWEVQYVLWDYEITEQETKQEKKTVTLELTDEQLEKIKEFIK